ncbi:uncharacterized mitochondrial protein AtMg00810-like [Helianthus annuus]|uniref:uncharacterized mitochondrial protein AtMg00810-like n=1 Tax=Helianthus annuus TaxID=4232 RepID=UPI000B90031D|nr:uncharacterized mitochondrial protein AtMg00810-like [Helianthus annuus]
MAYLLIYVDIILTTSHDTLRATLIRLLAAEFDMKDLGPLSHFLGINVTRKHNTMFLSHQSYALEIIDRAGMSSCKSVATLVDKNLNLVLLQGTPSFGLSLGTFSDLSLRAYADADWAGCPDTRRSTSGYCVYLGSNLLSWSSKRQAVVSRSRVKAEYRGVANVVAELCSIWNLLLELRRPLRKASVVYCGNISAVYLSGNPVHVTPF